MAVNAGGPEVAVGAVCIRGGHLLLVQRGHEPGRGRWSVPGGRVESGESLATAVTRELEEETGLTGRVTGLCGIAERFTEGRHLVILNHWVDVSDGEPVAGDDALAATWASAADLSGLDLVPLLSDFLAAHDVLRRLA